MNKTATAIIIIIIIALGAWLLLRDNDKMANNDDTSLTQLENQSGDTTTDTPNDTPDTPMGGVGIDVSGDTTVTAGTVKSFTVSATNYAFSPAAMSVNKGDTVRITLKDTTGNHDLKVDGYNVKTKILNSGGEDTIEFVADKSGTFEYYCTVGNHRAMGMKGTLTVK